MQTFLPYSDFQRSAACLDRRRLGKQRLEVLTILRVISGEVRGWANHPAVRMWKGHRLRLAEYGLVVCDEWIARGYRDSCRDKLVRYIEAICVNHSAASPSWLGHEEFHLSHRSNLVRKLPEHYRPLWPGVPDDLPYVWPV